MAPVLSRTGGSHGRLLHSQAGSDSGEGLSRGMSRTDAQDDGVGEDGARMSFAFDHPAATFITISHVSRSVPKRQMGRVHAGRVVASMPDDRAIRNGAVGKLERISMCEDSDGLAASLIIGRPSAISITDAVALPFPAVLPSADFAPEAFLGRASMLPRSGARQGTIQTPSLVTFRARVDGPAVLARQRDWHYAQSSMVGWVRP